MPVCDPTGPATYSRAATCILLHCYFPVWMPALNQPILHHCVSGFRNSVRAKEALVEASNRVSDKTPRRSRNIISKERSDWLALRLPTILYCIFVYRKNNRTTNGLWIPQDRQSLSYSTINCSELWRLAMQWDGLYRKRCMYMSSTHAILPRQPRIAPTVNLLRHSRLLVTKTLPEQPSLPEGKASLSIKARDSISCDRLDIHLITVHASEVYRGPARNLNQRHPIGRSSITSQSIDDN
jgi:hypothetical protein